MARIRLGDFSQPRYLTLPTQDGKDVEIDGEFLLKPTFAEDRRRWQKRFGMCSTCFGLRVLPLGDHTPKCPSCAGRVETPNLDTPDVQVAIAAELCADWRGVPNHDEGLAVVGEVPFTPESREAIVRRFPSVFWGMLRASEAFGAGQREVEQKN